MTQTIAHIELLGKNYPVNCSKEAYPRLLFSVKQLQEKMQLIRKNSKLIENEQIAVMTALHLMNELLVEKEQTSEFVSHLNKKITLFAESLQQTTNDVDNALTKVRK